MPEIRPFCGIVLAAVLQTGCAIDHPPIADPSPYPTVTAPIPAAMVTAMLAMAKYRAPCSTKCRIGGERTTEPDPDQKGDGGSGRAGNGQPGDESQDE
jgi:hypothetical protein